MHVIILFGKQTKGNAKEVSTYADSPSSGGALPISAVNARPGLGALQEARTIPLKPFS